MKLIEKVLGHGEDYYNDDYTREGFDIDYKLLEKILNNLSENEKIHLYEMIDCYSEDVCTIVKYILTK